MIVKLAMNIKISFLLYFDGFIVLFYVCVDRHSLGSERLAALRDKLQQ